MFGLHYLFIILKFLYFFQFYMPYYKNKQVSVFPEIKVIEDKRDIPKHLWLKAGKRLL